MNSSIKKVLTNSLLFSICIVICKALGFFLLPLYTNYLSEEEYGIANTVISFTSTFDILVMLGLREALIRFYNSYDECGKKQFVGTVISTVSINGIIVTLLLSTTHFIWQDWFLKGVDFFPIVLCGILTLLFETVYITYQSVLQSRQDGKGYSLNGILYAVAQALFNILYIVVFRLGALGVVLGALTANVIFAVCGILMLLKKKYIYLCLDRVILKKSLIYSLPFIPHNMSSSIANFFSKALLNNTVSYAATGLYAVSVQISTIMTLVQQSFNLAFRPWFNEQIECGEAGRKNICRLSELVFSLYTFVSIGVACFSQEIIIIFTADGYNAAWKVIPILVFALVIEFVYYIHILPIMYDLKASKLIATCSFIGAISNIIAANLLIPGLQSYGAAIAVLASKVIMSAITVVFSRKVIQIDLGLKDMIFKIAFSAVAISAGLVFTFVYKIDGWNWLNILYKSILLLFTAFILFRNYRKEINAYMKKLFKKWS